MLKIDEKWQIKFDEDEQQYIWYRIVNKSEMQAHLNNAEQQLLGVQAAKDFFLVAINDPRVEEEVPDKPP